MPYAKLADMMGFGAEASLPVLSDGDSVDFEVRDDRTGPLEGARLFIGQTELVGEHGHFQIPVSRELLSKNPDLRLVPPPGYKGTFRVRFHASYAFTFHRAQSGSTGFGERADLTQWKVLAVGPDRIYLEPPLTEADAQHLTRLLREGRALLVELGDVNPPPIAIGLMRDGAPERYSRPDPEGRTVWLERLAKSHADSFNGFLVHEWTHALLRQIGFPADAQLRYVEDGLAEILGHLAEQRLLAVETTPTLQGRRQELSALPSERRVDLYALAQEYAANTPQEIAASMSRPGVVDGYSLGMAYWYQRTQGRAEAVHELLTSLRTAMPTDAAAMETWLGKTAPSPRAFRVGEAQAWLGAR